MPGFGQINDRKTAKSKSTAAIVEKQFTGIVRATMRHHVAHALDERQLNIAARRSVFPDSANTTHRFVYDKLPACRDVDRLAA